MTGRFPQQLRAPQNLSLFLSGFFFFFFSLHTGTAQSRPRHELAFKAHHNHEATAMGLADVEDCETSYTSRMLSNSIAG